MEVYALVGASGTGKSTKVLTLAHQLGIHTIIDDGLLIHEGRKIAGYSSKYEQTSVAAIKRAIFHDPVHKEEIIRELNKISVEKLLILGTSKKMVNRIAEQLQLPQVKEYILIEDVVPQSEIRQAQFIRQTEGKHAIPIPQIQVEKDRWGRLIASVEKIFSAKKELIGERTIVRPPFQRGEIKIYESALKRLVGLSLQPLSSSIQIDRIDVQLDPVPTVWLTISLRLSWGDSIPSIVQTVRDQVRQSFLQYLDIELINVHVNVEHLFLMEKTADLKNETES
jgi:ABC-type dipeptide/oligopeptide/nickel transport system ATPase component